MTQTIPVPVDPPEADMAFPADVIGTYLPAKDQIPRAYWSQRHPMVQVAERWFMSGMRNVLVSPKEGIDDGEALKHLYVCLGSYQPKHEHKIAGVAYLLDSWFDGIALPSKTQADGVDTMYDVFTSDEVEHQVPEPQLTEE